MQGGSSAAATKTITQGQKQQIKTKSGKENVDTIKTDTEGWKQQMNKQADMMKPSAERGKYCQPAICIHNSVLTVSTSNKYTCEKFQKFHSILVLKKEQTTRGRNSYELYPSLHSLSLSWFSSTNTHQKIPYLLFLSLLYYIFHLNRR